MILQETVHPTMDFGSPDTVPKVVYLTQRSVAMDATTTAIAMAEP